MNVDDQLTRELDIVARGLRPSPPPVAELVARGRAAERRRRWYAGGVAAAVAAMVVGAAAVAGLGGGDDTGGPDPAHRPTRFAYPTGALPQVPVQVGDTTYVDGNPLPERYSVAIVQGFGALAYTADDPRWRVLSEPGLPTLPPPVFGAPAPHPDGDRVVWVDRTGSLVLGSFSGGRDHLGRGPHVGRVALVEGMDSAGNVYVTPAGVTAGPSATLRVWNIADRRTVPVTFAGAPVTLRQVTAAGLVFSTTPGGAPMLGVPDATGAVRESWALPDVLTLEPSPSGRRVAWLTDDQGREPQREDGWDGRFSSVSVQDVDGPGDPSRIDLPEGADVRAVRWEDETHVLLTLFGDERGTTQSLLRCDVTEGAAGCEYAVPPPG